MGFVDRHANSSATSTAASRTAALIPRTKLGNTLHLAARPARGFGKTMPQPDARTTLLSYSWISPSTLPQPQRSMGPSYGGIASSRGFLPRQSVAWHAVEFLHLAVPISTLVYELDLVNNCDLTNLQPAAQIGFNPDARPLPSRQGERS